MTQQTRGAYEFHRDGTRPHQAPARINRTIFVFGANLNGSHVKDDALVALLHYGALVGQGLGPMGHSYAIPTKRVPWEPLPLVTITHHIGKFKDYASANPMLRFWVTRIGIEAGYKDEQIAPLFIGSPPTCQFAEAWRPYILTDAQ